ncbi:hypothetical protein OG863_09845 [Streptomyces decoyicus]|uniref:Transposase n=1 Tax=Streptomyces decoyicus TaxID=249567 RepID=A0ABZ1FCX7_9ACTN|nr:hypothetical protein [Streptomyces decoyicus]WSB68233.1 hypothetical protein OG863_09845 [Streptomyces decoyicus]
MQLTLHGRDDSYQRKYHHRQDAFCSAPAVTWERRRVDIGDLVRQV